MVLHRARPWIHFLLRLLSRTRRHNSILIKFIDETEFKVEAKALGDAVRIGNDLNKLDK